MSGFNIKKASMDFDIKSDSFDSYLCSGERSNYLEIPCEKLSDDGAAILYILPSAFLELKEHICWKEKKGKNLNEQGGILVGSVFRDNSTQVVCGVVQHVIPSTKSGGATYIQFTHDDWILMYKEFEDKYSSVGKSKNQLKIIGWYHTHPNMPVNMSGIDKNTHVSFFSEMWQFSVILNPQRGTWAVFNGTECKNCNGYMYCLLSENINSSNVSEDRGQTQLEIPIQPESRQTVALDGSFVIKKRSNVLQNNSQRNRYPVQQVSHVSNNMPNSSKVLMTQRYKGIIFQTKITCYYGPLNVDCIIGKKSYAISDALVRRLASFIDEWSFESGESIAFIYYLRETRQFIETVSNVKYYTFSVEEGLSTDGFIFMPDIGEGFEYIFDSINKKDISLVVVYSAISPTYSKLHEAYGNYDRVLWINPHDANEFEFYVLDLNTKWAKNSFNMRNCGVSGIGQGMAERTVPLLCNSLSGWGVSGHLQTECDGVSYNKPSLSISIDLLEKMLCRINRYSKINSVFSIIISYKTADYITEERNTVRPWVNKLSCVRFVKNDAANKVLQCSFKGLDGKNYETKVSKFALIISNTDVDIDVLKHKLIGHLTAACFNIENKTCRFYRLY